MLWRHAEAVLDPPVRPLVAALNRTSWARTVFSCGGHPDEPDSVARGRRQAHVDVAVSDMVRWQRFVAECKRRLPRAVSIRVDPRHDRYDRHDRPVLVRLRCAEDSLGPVPEWLRPHLPPSPQWEYRRIVFEPAPYNVESDACRAALDVALGIAVQALEQWDVKGQNT